MKGTSRGWITSLIVIALVIAAMIPFLTSGRQLAQWSYSDLVRHAQAGEVKDVTISGGSATATDKNGAKTTYPCQIRPRRWPAT